MDPLKKIQVEGYAMFAEPELLFGNLDELCCVRITTALFFYFLDFFFFIFVQLFYLCIFLNEFPTNHSQMSTGDVQLL